MQNIPFDKDTVLRIFFLYSSILLYFDICVIRLLPFENLYTKAIAQFLLAWGWQTSLMWAAANQALRWQLLFLRSVTWQVVADNLWSFGRDSLLLPCCHMLWFARAIYICVCVCFASMRASFFVAIPSAHQRFQPLSHSDVNPIWGP